MYRSSVSYLVSACVANTIFSTINICPFISWFCLLSYCSWLFFCLKSFLHISFVNSFEDEDEALLLPETLQIFFHRKWHKNLKQQSLKFLPQKFHSTRYCILKSFLVCCFSLIQFVIALKCFPLWITYESFTFYALLVSGTFFSFGFMDLQILDIYVLAGF